MAPHVCVLFSAFFDRLFYVRSKCSKEVIPCPCFDNHCSVPIYVSQLSLGLLFDR